MSTYTSLSTDTKTFWIKAADTEIGYLKYTGWFSWKANISLSTGEIFKVVPKGFFGMSIEVKQSEKIWASFSMDWKGHLLLQTYFEELEAQIYVFKQQSLFKNAYVLHTANGAEILSIQPDYQWSRFRYDHRIETNEDFERLAHKNLFLIIAVYCTNHLITIQNASVGAGA